MNTTETLIKNFKPDDISSSAEAKELIIKLREEIRQSVTDELPFKTVWKEIKSRFPNYSDLFKKIETESGGDDFKSIQKLIDEIDTIPKNEINSKTKSSIENNKSLLRK
jgi:hypothetical protein